MRIAKVLTEEELRCCHAIRHEVFVAEQDVPVELEYDDYEASSDHYSVCDGDRVIATARIRYLNDGPLCI